MTMLCHSTVTKQYLLSQTDHSKVLILVNQ